MFSLRLLLQDVITKVGFHLNFLRVKFRAPDLLNDGAKIARAQSPNRAQRPG